MVRQIVDCPIASMSNKYEALKEDADNSDNGSSQDDPTCPNSVDLGPVEYPPGEHRLQHAYWLWYSMRPQNAVRSVQGPGKEGYTNALRLVGQVGTVEQWWSLYCHLTRLHDLPVYTNLYLFKLGIQPMWEDSMNAKGGKWVIRLRKGQVGRAWENICMAMLGEQFMVGNEICGVVVAAKYQEDLLSVWNRTASDQASTARIRDTLRRILNMPASVNMEYKAHADNLKYVSTSTTTTR